MAIDSQNQLATIFIVDDDDDARTALQRFLRSCGYQTEAFSSARAFLERLPIEGVSCLILDLQMPEMSGMALQEELTRTEYQIPIVFLTGHGDFPLSVTAIKRGAEDFLSKLADEEELLNAVERATERSRETLAVAQRVASLTDREREVCKHVVAGMLNKQIAVRLDIAERTVKAHRAKVMEKLSAESLAELVRLTAEAGIRPAESRPEI